MAKGLRSLRGAGGGRHGLRFRTFLFLSYGLLATLPLLVLSLIGTELYLDARREVTEERLLSTSQGIALATSAFLDEHRRLIGLAARGVESIERPDPDELDRWLARTGEIAPGLLTLILTDEVGAIVASDPLRTADGDAIRGVSVADRSYFRRPMAEGRPYLSSVFRGRGFGSEPIVAVSEPVRAPDGRVIGVLEASLDLSRLEDLLGPQLRVAGRRVVITDADGRVVSASPGSGLQALALRPEGSVCGSAEMPQGPPIVGRAATATGGWQVEVCRTADLLYAELRPIRRLLVGSLAGGLLLSLGLAWLGSSLAARPLVASERRFRELIEGSFGLICTHDLEGTLLSINPAVARSLGLAPQAVEGRNLRDFLHPTVRNRLDNDYLDRIRTEGQAEGVMHVVDAHGQERYWAYRNRLVDGRGGEPFVLGHALDVTERRKVERMLAEQALRDPLTGVGNRVLFFDRLDLEVGHARRDGTILALLFLDLDDFKGINDTLGHAAGDAVLRSIAEALQSHLRKVDTIARLGGDEFAVLLPAVGSAEQALRIAHHLVAAIGRPLRVGDEELRPRVSVGVSLFPVDAQSGEDLLAAADRAMYAAKRGGAGSVHRDWPAAG